MTTIADSDRRHLARAIEIAEQGRGRVSPNPLVGAVIADRDGFIGEGYHGELGGPHAEVEAIRAAGDRRLSAATMYVSLEPCCHHGRTPPCTDAIREAGIRRVLVASDDPSEHASGRGLGILRDEGVEVVLIDGELADRARLLNQPFRKHARTGRPWVLFKSAMTLDGKVATRSGDSKWISGEASRRRAHHWRAECDAVAVGIGTALTDDPQLTARVLDFATPELGAGQTPEGSRVGEFPRQPRRVVFDSVGRLPVDGRLVRDARRTPLTVVVSRAAPRAATDALVAHGADVIVATGENEPARVCSALDQLGAAGIACILLEGGPHLAGAFMDAGEVDEIRLFLAPVILGGRTARDPIEGEGVEQIAEAVRVLDLRCERIGEDLQVSARVRKW
ncbi:MAG TPA: bifunctional diaminohydroxyphosphoribosylaminopyrimidine deaminase/5-amino-6-(5-phosphoribosylamino)uracil reductase RibD [Solirubrobacteraceae bacterium]|jgi:diaminohydroxyphosphoribosylaminopyrimidine deaminase/5-amino-6-(5-phosphoribosylamino)uracil reductase|nr:bifunctional diaminohydroxyphosphoribosylaminopyrimidine deaminase/5-amino-6-(5-phosphoribosylamino)uracil reductase RibD [Solirubrobacteraceae bacterium]